MQELGLGQVLGNWLQHDGRWGTQAEKRARSGRVKERRMKEMGGFRGGLAMADAALVRESLVDAALMNGAVVSGRIASGDGGMTAAQQAELKRVQRRSVRAITGAPKATSTAAVDAEMGICVEPRPLSQTGPTGGLPSGVWHTPVAAPLPAGAGEEARGPLDSGSLPSPRSKPLSQFGRDPSFLALGSAVR